MNNNKSAIVAKREHSIRDEKRMSTSTNMNETSLMGYECSMKENTITENILKDTMVENIHFI